MSDLANSCEYFTIEKSCSAVLENQKAKTNRQLRCLNEEKMSCCYVCILRRECAVSCKYLGAIENQVPVPVVETKKEEPEVTISEDKKVEAAQSENAPVTFCSSCNVEMAQARTKFRIEGLQESQPKGAFGKFGEELPAIIYLCPICGRLEFRADERASK